MKSNVNGYALPLFAALLAGILVTSGEFAWLYGNVHIWGVAAALLVAYTACVVPRIRFRCVDILVLIFLLWMGGTCLRDVTRWSLNTIPVWVVAGAVWFLTRHLLTSATRRNAFLALVAAVIVAEGMLGLYQATVEIPSLRATLLNAPSQVKAEVGIGDAADWQRFTSRLQTANPTGTYCLANTLGGQLAVGLVLLGGFVFAGIRKHRQLVILLGISVCAASLFLTHSRSAVMALVSAILLVPHKWLRASLVVVVIVVGVVGLMASSSARRSLAFRWEYWQATAAMIGDAPLFGCGGGNFKPLYTQYKLPAASEEIADPHNAFMELASTGGIPAALLFLAILAVIICGAVRNRRNSASPEETQPEILRELLWCYLAAFGGGLVAVLIGMSSEVGVAATILLPLAVTLILVALNGVVYPTRGVLLAVIAVVLIHTLVAGGIAYTNTHVVLWLCLAMLANERDNKIYTMPESRWRRCAVVVPALLVAVSLYVFGFLPVTTSFRWLTASRNLPTSDIAGRLSLLNHAMAADTLSVEVARERLIVLAEKWRRGDVEWREVDIASGYLLTSLAPHSASLHALVATLTGEAAAQLQDKQLAEKTVTLWERAVDRYPTKPAFVASLAIALHRVGRINDAKIACNRARELDALTPHSDQKLTQIQRDELDVIVPQHRQ